ncbi:hypothetical protein EDB80DRAFT_693477 [Ilyonectria destructans]|nr:hypothetical protein EDB80DRAFT_693477 [Ilyonectria destructans]
MVGEDVCWAQDCRQTSWENIDLRQDIGRIYYFWGVNIVVEDGLAPLVFLGEDGDEGAELETSCFPTKFTKLSNSYWVESLGLELSHSRERSDETRSNYAACGRKEPHCVRHIKAHQLVNTRVDGRPKVQETPSGGSFISEDCLEQIRQRMHHGDRLDAENRELRRQIQDLYNERDRLGSYEIIHKRVIDTQDELIKSLTSSIISLNSGQPRGLPRELQMNPTISMPFQQGATSAMASSSCYPGEYSPGLPMDPNEAGAPLRADESRRL